MTLLAEACRRGIGWAWTGWDAWSHRHGQRATASYEYGAAKLGHAGGLLVAVAGMAVGLWIAGLAIERLLVGSDLGQRALAVAAVASAPLGARAALARRWGARGRPMNASLAIPMLVPFGLTVAALAPDRVIAVTVDALLACALSSVVIARAIGDACAAVRDMIDHPLPPDEEQRLAGLLRASGIEPGELLSVRSRRAGRQLILEALIDPHDILVDDAWPRIERARALVERQTPGLSVAMHWAPAAGTAPLP
ncbi:MAG: hypothetical protein U1E52_17685 [Geminicoccaceae bacterium]